MNNYNTSYKLTGFTQKAGKTLLQLLSFYNITHLVLQHALKNLKA